jgi:sporulation protein YlmC with PRC-barrel domain
MDKDTALIRVVDFAKTPGARYRTDGDNSAQEFFEDVVKDIADKTFIDSEGKLFFDLDYTTGYASSFVSELAHLMKVSYGKVKKIKKRIIIKSDEDPGQIERFWNGFNKKYAK